MEKVESWIGLEFGACSVGVWNKKEAREFGMLVGVVRWWILVFKLNVEGGKGGRSMDGGF